MAGQRKKNDDLLAVALASGYSVTDAAAKAGMAERTAYRRLADPAFCRRVQSFQEEMVTNALGRLTAGQTEAADVLRTLLKSNSETVRLSAARTLLDVGVKYRGAVVTEAKMKELEKIHDQVRKSRASKPH